MKITLKQLRLLGACDQQVELFKARFGEEVELTEALVMEHGKDFDLGWIAGKIFKVDILAKWDAELAPINAKWRAERAPINAKWMAERSRLFWVCVQMREGAK